jgi:hypothetical protein
VCNPCQPRHCLRQFVFGAVLITLVTLRTTFELLIPSSWVYRCRWICFCGSMLGYFGQGVVIVLIITSHLLVTVKQDWPVRVKSISSPKRKWLRDMNSLHPLEKKPVPLLGAHMNFTAQGSVSLGPRRCTKGAKLLP